MFIRNFRQCSIYNITQIRLFKQTLSFLNYFYLKVYTIIMKLFIDYNKISFIISFNGKTEQIDNFSCQIALLKYCKMFKFRLLINYKFVYPMNKNKVNQNWGDRQETSKKSVGVGDIYADTQRQIVQWTAVFFEGKFYLSDPYTILKLQQIQADIEFQKKIACQYKTQQYQKAESEREKGLNLNNSSYSCATEKTPQQLKKNQIKAEQELQKQQEIYHKNLVEFRNKRKNEEKKKSTKNIVKRHQEESKSQKQQKGENKLINLKQTFQSKQQNLKQNIFNSVFKQEKEECNILDMNQEQEIKLNNQFQKKSVQKDIPYLKSSPQVQNLKQSQKLTIKNENNQVCKLQTRDLSKKEPLKNEIPVEMQESVIINKLMLLDNEKVNDQRVYQRGQKNNDQYHNDKSQKKEVFQQRAGNSFFNDINSQIYKLQHNIEQGGNVVQTKQIQMEQPIFIKTNQQKYVKQSIVMINTKVQLNNQNQQHKKIKIIELEDDNKLTQYKIFENKINQKQLQIHRAASQKKKIQIKNETIVPKQVEITKQIPPKRKLHVMPSILNYQIVETKQKTEVQAKSVQKQKYQKQINLLQQVIGQLRVQRLKYNISQNSMHGFRVGEHSQTVLSSFQQIERDPITNGPNNNTRMTSPLGYNSLNNFAQSSVTQFTNSPEKNSTVIKSKSGKIIKNYTKQQTMPKIDEELAGQILDRVASEQKQPITIINHQIASKTENQNIEVAQKSSLIEKKDENNKKQIQTIAHPVKNASKESSNAKLVQKNNKMLREHNSKDKKQPNIKIKVISGSQCHRKSQSINKNIEKSNAATQQIQANINKVQKPEVDGESELPRPLPNRHTHTIPHKFNLPNNHQNIKVRPDVKRQLIAKFQQNIQAQANSQVAKPTFLDPKRRASRQGIIKNIQTKGSINPSLNRVVKENPSNIKKAICEMQQTKTMKPPQNIIKQRNDSKSIQNFRMRKQSQSFRNSRASSHNNYSSKSCDNTKNAKPTKDSMIYVPALNQKSFSNHHSIQYNEKLVQAGIQPPQNDHQINRETIQLQKRAISFSNLEIPNFPNPPDPNVSIQDIVQLIKKVGLELHMQLKDNDLHQILMKKYKNCIMLDLPSSNHIKLVWHFNGRLYIGEWNQTTMMKSGEGIQYIPDKYFYKGQFLNNKRNGNGIMVLQNGSKYQGQWQQGQKSGRGKYYDKSLGLYYEGEWKDGKRQGFGYFQVQGQSIYEGTFSTNYRFGYGTEKFTNGDCYKGQYQLGKFHGKGVYVWASGSSYQGFFVRGLKQGEGKWLSGTGQSYIGEYLQDKKHGKGRYKWQNGCIFEGQFASDKKNGYGILKYSNGREVKGLWQEGQLIQPILAPEDEREKPLNKRSGRNYQTMTLIKTVDSKPKRFSSSSKITNF